MNRRRNAGAAALLLCGVVTQLPLLAGGGAEGPRDFSGRGFTSVRIDGDVVAVEVRGNLGSRVDVRPRDFPPGLAVEYRERGSELEVWVERNFPLPSGGRTAVLTIDLPSTIDLDVETSTGAIRVEFMESEDLRLESSTGAIYLGDLRGDARVETSTGAIRIERVAGSLRVRSSTGSLDLRDINGALDAETSTGSITVRSSAGAFALETTTGSQEGREILISGDSSFRSTTGTIDIDFRNPLEDFSFELESRLGGIEVGSISGRGELIFGRGPITIEGESSTGSQTYR